MQKADFYDIATSMQQWNRCLGFGRECFDIVTSMTSLERRQAIASKKVDDVMTTMEPMALPSEVRT